MVFSCSSNKSIINLIILLFVLSNKIFAQNLIPDKIELLEFSNERDVMFNSDKAFEDCQKVYNKKNHDNKYDLIFQLCDEARSSIWESYGETLADNWYDCILESFGYNAITVEASSVLASQGKINYESNNLHDFNYKTVWSEGDSNYGIGETITFKFPVNQYHNPEVNTIIITNGYVKSNLLYKNNSRAKKIKVNVNNDFSFYLNLKDVISNQYFYFKEIGSKYQSNWFVEFEILDIYKGDKYKDVVITEINFEGIGCR